MRLKMYNLAKIHKAEIDIDGITVIAGSNNSGKSTVGKTIFSLYNSLYDLENKILSQKTSSILAMCRKSVRDILTHGFKVGEAVRSWNALSFSFSRSIAAQIMDEYQKQDNISYEFIQSIVRGFFGKIQISFETDEVDELTNKIYSETYGILQLSEITLSRALLSQYFEHVFNSQINTLQKSEKAVVALELRKRNIVAEFENHECVSLDSEIAILHKAVYIDNPFDLDLLDEKVSLSGTENPLVRQLISKHEHHDDQIIESVLAEEKMNTIFSMLSSVVRGRIVVQDGNYYLEDEDIHKPISVKNLSSGLKSFVLLKMLVEDGVICDNDVLVLDEPEIHLHPEWQIVYAELIVLLQKYMNLSIIVTTHSPYFLDAIDLFSKKHKISDRTNYYLSRAVDSQVEFKKVTEDLEAIYKEMASPISVLETLRYDLTEE